MGVHGVLALVAEEAGEEDGEEEDLGGGVHGVRITVYEMRGRSKQGEMELCVREGPSGGGWRGLGRSTTGS